MDYPDEHEVKIPEVGKVRAAMKPYIEQLSKQITDTIPGLVPNDELNTIKKSLSSLQIELMSRKELSKEDVHSIVDKVVGKLAIKKSSEPKTKLEDEILKFRPHDQAPGDVYGFYGFVHPNGNYYIVRHDVKEGKQRYSVGKGDYDKAWAKRDRLSYGLLSDKWAE